MSKSMPRPPSASPPRRAAVVGAAAALLGLAAAPPAGGEDWPTYRHDNRRSGVSGESLPARLEPRWTYASPVPPRTAWPGPAKWDAYSGNRGLQSMRNFDPVFYVTAVGDSVYFGSSVDDAAHCLDAATGEERWVAFAGGAVRLPPSWSEGRVYFGADDGFAYCVEAADGAPVWRYRPGAKPRLVANNGKLISPWPCRTGVLVQSGVAYFACSMLPWRTSYLCALGAGDGALEGSGLGVTEVPNVTLQGAFLASGDRLYAPQGRSPPICFDLGSRRRLGEIGGAGGVYCLLTDEGELISGPASQKAKENVLQLSDGSRREKLLTMAGANRVLVRGDVVYLHEGKHLAALDRARYTALQIKKETLLKPKKKDLAAIAEVDAALGQCFLWRVPYPLPAGFILAGGTLYTGGEGRVGAVDSETGKEVWTAEVSGVAYGLAAANGRLFVSTDRGHIYGFAGAGEGGRR